MEADESVHSVLQGEHAIVRQNFTFGDQAWSKHMGAQYQVLGSQ